MRRHFRPRFTLHMPHSIEGQLREYAEHPLHTERHVLMLDTWNDHKHWLHMLLKLVFPSTMHLTSHDEYHCQTVLQNIERVLGEDRIRLLSATDCFILLHAAYMHDISLIVSQSDHDTIILDDKFDELVEKSLDGRDPDIQEWARALRQDLYPIDPGDGDKPRDNREMYRQKLQVYKAFVYMLQIYQRKNHARKSADIIQNEAEEEKNTKLRMQFKKSGIPTRIFYTIADCAACHSARDYARIMALKQEDDGYSLDLIHPRFIATLVYLGDLLDMDSDRLHPMLKDYLGATPRLSHQHYEKHEAARQLLITPHRIRYEADCASSDSLRLVRAECDELKDLLQAANYHWPQVAPKNMTGSFPTFDKPILKMKGVAIAPELVSLRFEIMRERAFRILEGENIYTNRCVFLRELVQNAVDATKKQYWTEYLPAQSFDGPLGEEGDTVENIEADFFSEANIRNMQKDIYAVTVYFDVARRRKYASGHSGLDGSDKSIDLSVHPEGNEDYRQWPEALAVGAQVDAGYEYGVMVRVCDHGTGIGMANLLEEIAAAGRSKDDHVFCHMPQPLHPTAKFGLGMQSVFQVADVFYCKTRTRQNECFNLEFWTAKEESGHINATAVKDVHRPFGTEMIVFVRTDRFTAITREYLWEHEDPFAERGDLRSFHEEENLLRHMVSLLRDYLGEQLFPVRIVVPEAVYITPVAGWDCDGDGGKGCSGTCVSSTGWSCVINRRRQQRIMTNLNSAQKLAHTSLWG